MVGPSFFIEQPESWNINQRLVRFSGWVSDVDKRKELVVKINNIPQQNVKISDRADAAEWAKVSSALGWRFFCDAASLSTPEQGAIVLEVFIADQLVCRSYFRMSRRYRISDELLLFMHIPKTAGTSLRSSLQNLIPSGEFLSLYDENSDFMSITEFKQLNNSALSEINFVFGHFQFGLHEQIERPCRYVAFVRDPFSHMLSSFKFSKLWSINQRRSLEEALASGEYSFDNPQTRHFAGRCDSASIGSDDLARAIENIENHFAFVGVAEYYESSIDRICHILGMPIKAMWENKTPSEFDIKFLDMQDFRKKVALKASFDIKLYNYVLDRFWGGSVEHLLARSE